MTEPTPMSEVFEDELLLDLIAARADVGSEPVAEILGSLAAWSDQPIGPTHRTRHVVVPRRWRPRRAVATLGLLAIGLSGAGVAAAMTRSATVPSNRTHQVASPQWAAPTPAPEGTMAGSGLRWSTQPVHVPKASAAASAKHGATVQPSSEVHQGVTAPKVGPAPALTAVGANPDRSPRPSPAPVVGAAASSTPMSASISASASTPVRTGRSIPSPTAPPRHDAGQWQQGQQAVPNQDVALGATGGAETDTASGQVAARPGRGNGGQPPGQVAGPGTPATGATGNGKYRGRPSPTPSLKPQDGSTGQRARSSARTVSATDAPAAPQSDAPPQP